ncbi:MAG: DNA gyrase subunit A [Archaeoglobus sp.]|nr:MAG: DNA gyrase subunit A [Archaeoglobus sp.]
MELLREITSELKSSYIDYAMSVIVGRALPDVRDGLKPVQRRILYAMYEMGLLSNKPYRKCARIVGDVLGKYHPHGDTAVYDALVRMAQDFTMRYPLIDGQGNFGSIDGDSPAAMRYTEARLAKIAEEMLADIDKETVEFTPNFDATLKEPEVLPAKIPNLLVNGSSGIAVGMATNIPPHNLRDVCKAIIACIRNPEISIDELIEYVKGPDFPTGGIITGFDGISEAYRTGKGKITVRGRVEIDGNKIIIKEIPYMVNKAKLVERIAELISEGRLDAGTVRDESDREGIRIVIEVKEDVDTALNKLYAYTNLQTTFGIIMLALVDGKPKVLTLKEIIEYYIDHRREVIRRRTAFELRKAEERLHVVEGLKKAIENIEEVISLIKSSTSPTEAKNSLMKRFNISDRQAEAILQTRLQKLTSLEIEALFEEYKMLRRRINEYRSILSSPEKIDSIITKEVEEIMEKYGDRRRTSIEDVNAEISAEELISEEMNLIITTKNGMIKRLGMNFKLQKRGGVGVVGIQLKDDVPSRVVVCSSKDKLLIFDKKKAYWINAYEIPKLDRHAKGVKITNLVSCGEIVSIIPIREFDNSFILLVTEDGYIKKIKLKEFENAKRAGITATSGKLTFACMAEGEEVFISTKNGYTVRFDLENVSELGRTAKGVRGINLRKGDCVIWVSCRMGKYLLTVSKDGYIRKTARENYRKVLRGSMGVINYRGEVAMAEIVEGVENLVVVSSDGYLLRTSISEIPVQGRKAKGVLLCRKEVACCAVEPSNSL